MSAGEGDLERPSRLELAANLGEVRDPWPVQRPPAAGRPGHLRVSGARRSSTRGAAMRSPRRGRRPGRAPRRPRASRRRAPRSRRPAAPRRRPSPGRRPAGARAAPAPPTIGRMPGHRPDLAAERQLADQRDPAGAAPNLLRAEQDPHRDREIERRAGLAQVGRREVDGDPARRMDEAGVPERAADAFAGLLERGVREADDREPGQSGGDVDLDADHPPVEADERRGGDDREHAPQATERRSPAGSTAHHRALIARQSVGANERA